jgi:hypothetical protein
MYDRAGYSRCPANLSVTRYERIGMNNNLIRFHSSDEPNIVFAFSEYEAKARRLEDQRRQRDRELATAVGIEVGLARVAARRKEQDNRIWDRGFMIGVFVTAFLIALVFHATEMAFGSTTRIGSGEASQRVTYKPHLVNLPPGYKVYLEICKREQPAKGSGWRSVAWKQTHNHSYPGGCGLTRQNYLDVKHPSWPDSAHLLSPRDQLWASFWLYWKYARIGQAMLGSYEAGQRYGSTVWDVHDQPGLNFHGFGVDGQTMANR